MTRLLPILLLWCVVGQAQVFLPHRHAIVRYLGPCDCSSGTSPAESLLARWAFEESSGYITDDISGNGNRLLLQGNFSRGTFGGGNTVILDGVNAFMRTCAPLNISTSIFTLVTVLKWNYPTAKGYEETFCMGENPYYDGKGCWETAVVHANNTISMDIDNGDGTINGLRWNYPVFATNNWLGIARVYDNSTTNGNFLYYTNKCTNTPDIYYKTNKNWAGNFDNSQFLYIGQHGTTNDGGGGLDFFNANFEFKDIRFYAGALTPDEICYCFSHFNDSGTPSAASTLVSNLVSFWPMEERSGTRHDIWGTNNLRECNATINCTGKRAGVQNGALFTWNGSDTSTNALVAEDSPGLSSGSVDFTLTFWASIHSNIVNYAFVFKRDDINAEYQTRLNATTHRFMFDVTTGAGLKSVSADALGAPSVDTRYFIATWMDTSADTINIQVNNGNTNSLSLAGARPSDTTAKFYVGAAAFTPPTLLNGNIDEVGFWKRVLSNTERAALYNSGKGRTIP